MGILSFLSKTLSLKSSKSEQISLDEQFRNLSYKSQEHLRNGKIGLYSCDLYSLSEINRKEKKYDKQLHLLTLSAYIHLSGVDTLDSYSYWKSGDFSITQPDPLLPPAVIRSINTCIKRNNMSIEQYKDLYFNIIDPTLTPAHVFGVEKTLDIICTYLNSESERADKMVSSGTKKFIRELSSKGW